MIRSRRKIKIASLCLALAGLMAIGTSSAQAEAGSFWLVNGTTISGALLPSLAATLENNHGVLLGAIGGVGLHILCTGITLIGAHLVEPNGGVLGKVRFTGCKILRLKEGKAEALAACAPPGGTIETTEFKGLLRLHKLQPSGPVHSVIDAEPAAGTIFTTFNTSEECAFGEKITINGKLSLIDCEGALLVDKVTHLFSEFAPLTELYVNGNKANKAILDGSINVVLAGAHAGLTWAGHPG